MPTLKELSNELDSVVDWHSLGIKLGMKAHELKTIEENCRGNDERCKHEMLSRWLRSSKHPTWKAVATALDQMEKHEIASKIYKKHCSLKDTGMYHNKNELVSFFFGTQLTRCGNAMMFSV